MRRLELTVAVALASAGVFGCGGGGQIASQLGDAASSSAARVADHAAATRGSSLSTPAARRAIANERPRLLRRTRTLAEWVGEARERVEPACMHIVRAKLRAESTDEQLYTATSEGAKALTSYAAFVDIGKAIASLSDGDLEDLWDAWCA